MTSLTGRSIALVGGETTSTTASRPHKGSLAAISPTAPAATTTTPGHRSFRQAGLR